MAFASSIRKAQIPLKCQLCDEGVKINWKCLDCDVLLCDRCKTIHSRVKTQLVHSIIDLKEVRAQDTIQGPKVELKAVRCSLHKQQICCIYCRDCKQLACPTCLSQNHKKHDLEDLDTIYKEQVEVLRHFHIKFSNELLDKTKIDEQLLQQAKNSHETQIETTKQEIKDKEKALHDEISKQSNKLISDTDKRMQVVDTAISTELSSVMETRTNIEAKSRILIECMESNDIERVLNVAVTAEQEYAQIQQRECNIPMETLTLVSRPLLADDISTIFGPLQDTAIPEPNEKNTEVKFELIKTFKTAWTLITIILPCDDGSFYINCKLDGSNHVTKVLINNEITATIPNFKKDMNIHGMTKDKNKRLLVTPTNDSKIYYLCEDGTLEEFKDLSPMFPCVLHHTMDHFILVSTEDQNNHCQLLTLGQDGRVVNTIEFDHENRRLFTGIFRITTDVQGNIYVVDWYLEDTKGRIISLDKDGGLRWIYEGDKYKEFFPVDMVQTHLQNWIIYDINNHMLHILNSNGKLITFKDLDKIRMTISCMAIYKQGQLLLGYSYFISTGQMTKLQIVQFSGI